MKLSIFSIVFLSLLYTPVISQVASLDSESPLKERFYLGGGMDLAVDQNRTLIGVSPSLGFMLTKSTSIGTGITYQIYYDRFNQFNTTIYGYRFFLRQNLIAQIFAYAEYENLSYEVDFFVDNSDREWQDAFYLGGGYYKPITDRFGFLAIGLYNMMNRNYTGSPWSFRAGFTYSPFSR